MALTTEITGRDFPPFGTVGETPNFQPFTQSQIDNGDMVISAPVPFIVSVTNVAGETTENAAITNIVADTKTQSDAYINDFLNNPTATYLGKIYIINVERKTLPAATIQTADKNSPFVERQSYFNVSVRLEVQLQ